MNSDDERLSHLAEEWDSPELSTFESAVSSLQTIEPLVSNLLKLSLNAYNARRTEILEELQARVQELHATYDDIANERERIAEERERGFTALMAIIELARKTGSPELVRSAMDCYIAFAKSSPDFTGSLKKVASQRQREILRGTD